MSKHSLKSAIAKLKAQAAAAVAALPQEPDEEGGLFTLAALAELAWGEADPRASIDHVRTLDRRQQIDLYRDAIEAAALGWQQTEEGKRFLLLSYPEQIAEHQRMMREEGDILMNHCMRKAMKRW
jgi:hypothetical protein